MSDTSPDRQETSPSPVKPTFGEALLFWLKLGWISFGGPAGQIAIMHQELVERKKWISNERFLHALNYCMLLPGPEAQQLATYIGWILHRGRGGLIAGVLFVLPSAFILFCLSYVYVVFGNIPAIVAILAGLKAAVLAIVLSAVIKIGKKSLKNTLLVNVAVFSFLATYFLRLPFPVLIIGIGIFGVVASFAFPQMLPSARMDADSGPAIPLETRHRVASLYKNIALAGVFIILWIIPFLAVLLLLPGTIFSQEALFFTKAAFLTFGGAYALLAYIAQAGVQKYAWLTTMQMMDGLGLAETTPGPLIMVVQFVGFLAGWNHPGHLTPLAAAMVGSAVATYFTFLPSFFFIFAGAPYIERLSSNARMAAALSTITPAVVGVIFNLGLWFGEYVLFPKSGFAWWSAILALGAFVAMQRFKVGIIPVIAGCGLLGLFLYFVVDFGVVVAS